jgi:RNA polymerase sigma-70 factor (ECF subfamily)
MSDLDVVHRAAAGSEEAFAELVLAHQAAVRGYLGRYVRGRETVDDLAQECFLAAHRGLGTYRAEAPFRIWLLSIARHLAASFLREEIRRRQNERSGELAAWLAQHQADSLEAGALPLADHVREVRALQDCLKKLPRDEAELVRSYYFRERSSVALADRLGKKQSAVRMTLLRIRHALRACIERQMPSGAA